MKFTDFSENCQKPSQAAAKFAGNSKIGAKVHLAREQAIRLRECQR
jgi:hypothetical protein